MQQEETLHLAVEGKGPANKFQNIPIFWAVALGGLLLVLPLVATPVLPYIDLYNHIARYFVLGHIDELPFLFNSYQAAWALLPNLGLDFLATPLLRVVDPLIAAKLVVGAVILLQYGGVLFLNKALFGKFSILPVMLLTFVLYSFILHWGFINFLLGLALVFWVLGLWVRMIDRPLLASLFCALGAIIIFFSHGLAFALYGLALAGLEFGRFLGTEPRSMKRLLSRAALLAGQAVVPIIIFLNMPTAKATGASGSLGQSVAQHISAQTLAEQFRFEFVYRLRTIYRFTESPYALLDAMGFVLLVTTLVVGLKKRWLIMHPWMTPVVIVGVILCVVTPPSLFGVGYLADRMPLFLAFVVIASTALADKLPKSAFILLGLVALLIPIRLFVIAKEYGSYRQHYADFLYVADTIGEGDLVGSLMPYGRDRRDGLLPRCQMYAPLLVPYKHAAVPLFANPTQQPLRQVGKLREAVSILPKSFDTRVGPIAGAFDKRLALMAADAKFDYVLMCGRDRLEWPLPKNVSIVRERGGVTLLSIN